MSVTYAHLSGTDAESLHRLAGHVLAFYGREPLEGARDFVTIHQEYSRLTITAPYRVSNVAANSCLDTSRQAEIAAWGVAPTSVQRGEESSPYNWLWSDALPLLLPAHIVEMLNKQYKLRDRLRQRAVRRAARSVAQGDMFDE